MAKKLQHVRFNDPAERLLDSLSERLRRPKAEIVRALVEPEIGIDDPVLASLAQLVRATAQEMGAQSAAA